MQLPRLSAHFAKRAPSAIRLAQIEYLQRTDGVAAVNTAIGNVSLPMHPAMQARMRSLGEANSPFTDGVVAYTPTVGTNEARQAVMAVLASSGLDTRGLEALITDGGSAAMELLIAGVCGPAGSTEAPLLLIDAAYTNYKALASRLGRSTVSVQRHLGADGRFTLPDMSAIEATIKKHQPNCLVVIPYDNPTGHFYDHDSMCALGRLAVKHNLWLASDEAYRELFYLPDERLSSIWALSEAEVPGITGRRISIETASKVWNACGLRIGALVTDNEELHRKAVAEYTANLCANTIGQWIYATLATQSPTELRSWYSQQREYYRELMLSVSTGLRQAVPGLIVSSPDASIYSVVDVRSIAAADFDARDFVLYCAQRGKVDIAGQSWTLLVSPMAGFYADEISNPGRTQMRIAYVEPPQQMALVPRLFSDLLQAYSSPPTG